MDEKDQIRPMFQIDPAIASLYPPTAVDAAREREALEALAELRVSFAAVMVSGEEFLRAGAVAGRARRRSLGLGPAGYARLVGLTTRQYKAIERYALGGKL